jgi:hypothetical protein
MKKSLIVLSALLCGSVFAQQNEFVPGPPREVRNHDEVWEQEAAAEDVLLLAQGPGGRAPNAPGGGGGGPGAPKPFGGPGAGKGGPVPPQGGHKPMVGGGGGGGGFPPGGPMIAPFQPPAKPTVIVASKMDDTARQNIREDMQIMSRLLDKAAERAMEKGEDRRMGIVVSSLPGMRGENIFLEDHGPVFVLNVPMQLAGAKKADGSGEEKSASDWEQAKRELYEKKSPGAFQAMKYDSEKVEALKKALLETLKHASNIRQLKPDQMITVAVIGAPNASGVVMRRMVTRQGGEAAKEQVQQEMLDGKGMPAQPTTLTVRVKKGDVDALAAGKLEAAEFSKRALISAN